MRRRNHLAWIGASVTFLGAVSYFLVFSRWPALRDFPWVNLPLVLAGFAASLAAYGRRRRGSKLSGALALAGAGFSTLVAALFCAYVFWISWLLPAPTRVTLALDRAPDFALAAQDGGIVRLADLHDRKVVLVFFRGFW